MNRQPRANILDRPRVADRVRRLSEGDHAKAVYAVEDILHEREEWTLADRRQLDEWTVKFDFSNDEGATFGFTARHSDDETGWTLEPRVRYCPADTDGEPFHYPFRFYQFIPLEGDR